MGNHDEFASSHRKHAAELREIAALLSNLEHCRSLLELADDYDRRAVAHEKRSKARKAAAQRCARAPNA